MLQLSLYTLTPQLLKIEDPGTRNQTQSLTHGPRSRPPEQMRERSEFRGTVTVQAVVLGLVRFWV